MKQEIKISGTAETRLRRDGKFLHGQELAHPLSKGSLDMTGRRGRRNLDSLGRRRPLLRPGGASAGSGAGALPAATVPPRGCGIASAGTEPCCNEI
ncbi:hypothetical protein RLOC_00010596 [Lonchura striata]|uniref:Uncharacterized protein n=1 Tax=Lonchura striata TaxID=40157 RepID=A0A218UF50_9PASE|nr:hypothetical protein RLOC_00010596 [Lonchura striata domestica]